MLYQLGAMGRAALFLAALSLAVFTGASPASAQLNPSSIDDAAVVVQKCCTDDQTHQIISGRTWAAGDQISLYIRDALVATATARPDGSVLFDYAVVGDVYADPGDEVRFVGSSDGRTESHIVTDLSVSHMDVVTDTITGSASPGSDVLVFLPGASPAVSRIETADAEGAWSADLSVPGDQPGEEAVADIGVLTRVSAGQIDDAGNATVWATTPATYAPIIVVLDGAQILGASGAQAVLGQGGWANNDEVDLFVNGDYVATAIADGNSEGCATPGFDLTTLGITLLADDQVTLALTDGSRTETTVVADLALAGVDYAADTVAGHAQPAADVWVSASQAFYGTPVSHRLETTNSAGQWSADFSVPGDEPDEQSVLDLVETTVIQATQFDDGGNATYVWQIPDADYVLSGFARPVDDDAVNVATAGRTVPLKFRVTTSVGDPVIDITDVSVAVTGLLCELGTTADQIEEYAAGNSGLLNLGDGYYQYNWKTPRSYQNSCKLLQLSVGDGQDNTAEFHFTR